MTTKTLKLTKVEHRMLKTALRDFELGFDEGWDYSGYSKAEVKAFYRLREKAEGVPVPNTTVETERDYKGGPVTTLAEMLKF